MRFHFVWLLPLLLVTAYAEDAAKPSAPAAEVREMEVGDLKLTVPTAWKQQQPSNNLRLAQFAIAPAEGDTESTEMVVSPPIGGSIEANIARWIDQFDKAEREVVMTKGTCSQGEYVMVQLKGTYKLPIGPPFQRKTKAAPGYRMHGVILTVTKNGDAAGNYFLKLTGPEKTVLANDAAYYTAIGADKSKEEKYELP